MVQISAKQLNKRGKSQLAKTRTCILFLLMGVTILFLLLVLSNLHSNDNNHDDVIVVEMKGKIRSSPLENEVFPEQQQQKQTQSDKENSKGTEMIQQEQEGQQLFDPHGYMLLCLCMGRYGNQMEHLLGVLAKAKRYNRTLVLPPFINYEHQQKIDGRLAFIPVEDIFQLEELQKFHSKIIPMSVFMKDIAPTYWKPSQRIMYCPLTLKEQGGCKPKNGNPFGPYWDEYGVDFVEDYYYNHKNINALLANENHEHPIIATKGAMAPFPMAAEARYIARYFVWNEQVQARVDEFMEKNGMVVSHTTADNDIDVVVVGIHLRAGSDWVRACKNGVGQPSYMASPQCSQDFKASTGQDFIVTQNICLPTADMAKVAKTLERVSQRARYTASGADGADDSNKKKQEIVLFLASDVEWLGPELMTKYQLSKSFDRLVQQSGTLTAQPDPFLDLAVLHKADYFVGNCVSSFTSFVARMRTEQDIGLGTEFFGLN